MTETPTRNLTRAADQLNGQHTNYARLYIDLHTSIGPQSPQPGRRPQPGSHPPAGRDHQLHNLLVHAARTLADAHHIIQSLKTPPTAAWETPPQLGARTTTPTIDCQLLDGDRIVCVLTDELRTTWHETAAATPPHPRTIQTGIDILRGNLGNLSTRPLTGPDLILALQAARTARRFTTLIQPPTPSQTKRCGWCATGPVKADDRCTACWSYRHRHGRERPPHLLTRRT